jgi:flagellar protein FliO/FliZ
MKRTRILGALLVAILLLGVSFAKAQEDSLAVQPPQSEAQASDGSYEGMTSLTDSVLPSLGRIGLSLLLIIVFIYVTVYVLRRMSGARGGRGSRGRTIQIIEQTHLSPRKSICLVKLADRAVLVGITENNINLLTEFDSSELPAEAIRTKVNGQTFSEMLSGAAQKMFGRGEAVRKP